MNAATGVRDSARAIAILGSRPRATPMARRIDPVRKSVKDVYADLVAGYNDAGHAGPAEALKYVERTLLGQESMPNAVRCFAYDLIAASAADLKRWERCAEAVVEGLERLPAAEADLPAELRAALPTMALWDRGIAARMELGDFAGALDLCDDAIARGLGAHYEAKRDSLSWAR